MSMEMRLRALRGATTAVANERDAILSATRELLEALLERNSVDADQIVSIMFTSTQDLDAEFPAVAARSLGIADVALMCAAEIAVPGSLPRCIRVLMHLYSPLDYGSLRHVYLGEARELRSDLPG